VDVAAYALAAIDSPVGDAAIVGVGRIAARSFK
jgi:hypothetical protein